MIQVDYPRTITNAEMFRELEHSEMQLVVQQGKIKRFAKGCYIIKENETGDEFYWISKGDVEIQINPSLKSGMIRLNHLGAGDVLGEMLLLDFPDRTASALALSDVSVYAWNAEACLDFFEKNPAIGYKITRSLGHILGKRMRIMNAALRSRIEGLDDHLKKVL